MKKSYHVKSIDIPVYDPANHSSTQNKILIGDNVNAKYMQVILGVVEKNGGALIPHSHDNIEQACYLLEGTAHATVEDQAFDMLPGDMCFFPSNVLHTLTATSEQPAKFLVIYSPPNTQGQK